jgi:hypothetical protein
VLEIRIKRERGGGHKRVELQVVSIKSVWPVVIVLKIFEWRSSYDAKCDTKKECVHIGIFAGFGVFARQW